MHQGSVRLSGFFISLGFGSTAKSIGRTLRCVPVAFAPVGGGGGGVLGAICLSLYAAGLG